MKPTRCPAREKNKARKAKKEGRREGQDCCVTFKPKNSNSKLKNLEILLSLHAQTSQAYILQSGSEGCEVYRGRI